MLILNELGFSVLGFSPDDFGTVGGLGGSSSR